MSAVNNEVAIPNVNTTAKPRGILLLGVPGTGKSAFAKGARVFHLKFGPGTVALVDGNKLTVDFDKAGRKMVLESFVQAV